MKTFDQDPRQSQVDTHTPAEGVPVVVPDNAAALTEGAGFITDTPHVAEDVSGNTITRERPVAPAEAPSKWTGKRIAAVGAMVVTPLIAFGTFLGLKGGGDQAPASAPAASAAPNPEAATQTPTTLVEVQTPVASVAPAEQVTPATITPDMEDGVGTSDTTPVTFYTAEDLEVDNIAEWETTYNTGQTPQEVVEQFVATYNAMRNAIPNEVLLDADNVTAPTPYQEAAMRHILGPRDSNNAEMYDVFTKSIIESNSYRQNSSHGDYEYVINWASVLESSDFRTPGLTTSLSVVAEAGVTEFDVNPEDDTVDGVKDGALDSFKNLPLEFSWQTITEEDGSTREAWKLTSFDIVDAA